MVHVVTGQASSGGLCWQMRHEPHGHILAFATVPHSVLVPTQVGETRVREVTHPDGHCQGSVSK